MKTKLILLVAVLLMAVAPLARGDVIELTLSSGGSSVTIADNGGGDLDTTAGVIAFIGPVGAWSLNTTVGVMDFPAAPVGSLDVNSLDATATGLAPLTIQLTRTGILDMTLQAFVIHIGGTFTAGNGFVLYQAYRDQSNTPYGTSELIGTVGPIVGDPVNSGAFAGTAFSPYMPVVSTPYSLTQVITLDPKGAATTVSFDAYLQPVPEPGTGILLGLGVLALGTILRRRLV